MAKVVFLGAALICRKPIRKGTAVDSSTVNREATLPQRDNAVGLIGINRSQACKICALNPALQTEKRVESGGKLKIVE